jgi:hypothetical protein
MSNLPPYDLDRALARQHSYTFACVVVMVLYCFLWFPGLVANYLYLEDARRMEDRAGEPLPGVGGLRLMWALTGWLAGLVVAFVLFVVVAFLLRSPS